ncbi:hypothetical protein SESBI_16503 [Sesbania bispinosa]|nr:hypothetical protein SESBI_16503 [Sesbania bispinosa]
MVNPCQVMGVIGKTKASIFDEVKLLNKRVVAAVISMQGLHSVKGVGAIRVRDDVMKRKRWIF